jgi:hypothetical protein
LRRSHELSAAHTVVIFGQTLFGKDVANIRKELSAERVILDNSDQC